MLTEELWAKRQRKQNEDFLAGLLYLIKSHPQFASQIVKRHRRPR